VLLLSVLWRLIPVQAGWAGETALIVLGLGLINLCGWASYRLVERPAISALRHGLPPTRRPAPVHAR
jgi:peptidoglycan/LPS O-acetylase OafA/YrhL